MESWLEKKFTIYNLEGKIPSTPRLSFSQWIDFFS